MADRMKLNLYFDIHKRADDLARVQMAITTQTEVVQAVFEAGEPVPKEDRDTFRKENNFMKIAFWKSSKVRSFEVDKDAVKKAMLTSGFFIGKTLGLDLDPMEAKSRYGMRDEQAKTFMLQKGPLGEDRLRACTESSKHGMMFICFVVLILASYIRYIRDTKPELTKAFPSMAAILEEMQTIRCIEHDGRRKFITPFVGEQVLSPTPLASISRKGAVRHTHPGSQPRAGVAARLSRRQRLLSANSCKTQMIQDSSTVPPS